MLGLFLGAVFCITAAVAAPMMQQAPVISVEPILEYQALPQEQCQALTQGRQLCTISTQVVERVRAYQVTYEYQGRLYTGELSYHPGSSVMIELPSTSAQSNYNSQRQSSSSLVPGRKTYGSSPATGESASVIEYRDPQPQVPILVELEFNDRLSSKPR